MRQSDRAERIKHCWVTVVNPTNHRVLLQACDNCGVVKSENSVMRHCHAAKGQALVSGAMTADHRNVC